VTVPSAAHVLTPPVPFADEVTFDGVACEVAGRRVAGTAAILWGPERNQPMSRLAVATVALPHVPQAPEAEAWGGALRSPCCCGWQEKLVRFRAAMARLRSAEHQQ